jgi:hypothetical protein
MMGCTVPCADRESMVWLNSTCSDSRCAATLAIFSEILPTGAKNTRGMQDIVRSALKDPSVIGKTVLEL